MPLISERFLWDWTQKLAKEQNEPWPLVLVELLKAIERNELPATFPDGPYSKQHDFKDLIEKILMLYSAGWDIIAYISDWDAIAIISITSSDVESWLAHRTSTEPKPAGTPNLPTGMPIVPSNTSAVATYIACNLSTVERRLARRISTKPKPAGTANLPTGMPGRPSKGKDIIEKEFARRAAAGETLCLPNDEAEALRNWYQNEYPDAQIPTKKTIKNNIGGAHRKWLNTQQQTSPTQRNGPKL